MISLHQEWRDFICAPEHSGRHLASIGSAINAAKADAIDSASLTSFLSKLERDDDIRLLADTVDLLSGTYLDFIEGDLPRVLDTLAKEDLRRDEIVGPALKGNPRWDRTFLGRMSGSLRPGQYVSRTAHRSYELPENSLLRWLIDDLAGAVEFVRRRSKGNPPHDTLQRIGAGCAKANSHHWFGGLRRPRRLDPAMLSAARLRRRSEYSRAAALAESRSRFDPTTADERWHSILMLLSVGWLEPVDVDDLFELYCLVLVLDVLTVELGLGEPEEYGLVLAGRGHVAKFRPPSGTLSVHFDQGAAPILGIASRYSAVVRAHAGINGNPRRPDILLVWTPAEGSRRTLLVEMKKSTDGGYLSDSIYKVFGYLYDFAAAWNETGREPTALLLVPEGVAPEAGVTMTEVAIATAGDRAAMADAIRSALLS